MILIMVPMSIISMHKKMITNIKPKESVILKLTDRWLAKKKLYGSSRVRLSLVTIINIVTKFSLLIISRSLVSSEDVSDPLLLCRTVY